MYFIFGQTWGLIIMNDLLKAIQHGKPWIDSFNRVEYQKTFEVYSEKFAAVYIDAVNASSDLSLLASELVDSIIAGWDKEHFFSRGAAKINDKMMIVVYLTPMLLASENERCHQFADILCSEWNKKIPQNTYSVADYDTITNGFTNKIMGFEIKK